MSFSNELTSSSSNNNTFTFPVSSLEYMRFERQLTERGIEFRKAKSFSRRNIESIKYTVPEAHQEEANKLFQGLYGFQIEVPDKTTGVLPERFFKWLPKILRVLLVLIAVAVIITLLQKIMGH